VGFGIGVRILPGDGFKGHHFLISEGVLREDLIASAETLIEGDVGRIGIDRLGREVVLRARGQCPRGWTELLGRRRSSAG
jgi:hypothetical protein